ncbi:hypothetical protein N9924_00940 [bacterium]|nr:hypothetical protein [bacterium]
MKRVTAYVEDELKDKIRKYCKENFISESTFIKLAAIELMKEK